MAADVAVSLLGAVQVYRARAALTVSAPMQRALLAFLALDVQRAAPIDEIVDALWADPPDQCINTVQQYVAGLRRLLGPDAIETHGRAYRLAVSPDGIDYTRFIEQTRVAHAASRLGDHARAQRIFTMALNLWRGRALADLPDCPFVQATRMSFKGERERAQLALWGTLVAQGEAADALPDLERAVAERPLDEAVAAVLVRALAVVGRKADALSVYEATRARLVGELGLDPGPDLRAAQAAVLEQRGPQLDENSALTLPILPRPRTSLLGRDNDLHALAGLLEDGAPPIITVTGPGGVGKTRIALALAARTAEDAPVIFVELAALTDPGQVLPAVATAVGVKASDHGTLAERVARMLRDTGALLVLDNFEHVLGAAVDLDQLVGALDDSTRVLVTSRARLGLAGEQVVALEPLPTRPLPEHSRRDSAEGVEPVAVTLFRERAEAAHPGALTHSDATILAAVCDRLDGLPLAIELAAARADLVPPELLLARLDKRLALLGSGPQTAPHRHRTLHACIGWSVDQIPETERQLFAVMSVFGGSAALASIEQVSSRLLPDLDVLTALDTLVRNNLCRVEATPSGPRLSMLETIREFAHEELVAIGLSVAAHTAHADHYRRMFTVERSTVLWPPRTLGQYAEWNAEMPNARLALTTFHNTGRRADAAALAVALFPMWLHRGEWDEAEAQLSQVMASPAMQHPLQAQVLLRLAVLADRRGGRVREEERLQEALEICRRHSDPWIETQILFGMAQLTDLYGEPSEAIEWERKARRRAAEAQDPELLAMVHTFVANVGNRGLDAVHGAAEGPKIARVHGNEGLAFGLEVNLSNYAISIDDADLWQRGKQWGESAAIAADTWGDKEHGVIARANADTCALLLGYDARAIALRLRKALDWFTRCGDVYASLETQLRLAAALSAIGELQLAAGLAASAQRLGRENGVQLDTSHRLVISRYIDGLRDQLGPDAYDNAIRPWETLTWDQAAKRALAVDIPGAG